jgi:ATP-binding cassette subfamily F protein uup
MAATDAGISGRLVAVSEHMSKSFGSRPIVKDLTTRVLRGDRLGIIGPNGAGKTTLLKLLTGQLQPDCGSIKLGSSLNVITLDQQRATLNPATMSATSSAT